MKPTVAVVDYGMGNLRSVQKALEKIGARAVVTDSPTTIRRADAVVLPGVGAFGEAAKSLKRQRLWGPVEETLGSGKPFLGICLGLQLLFERSEESRGEKGFGFLEGSVERFRFPSAKRLKVPHMGWNTLRLNAKNRSPWGTGMTSKDYFYFVHSYFPAPKDKSVIAATTSYGIDFCSAAAGPSWFASQFHPEKSGEQGLRLLRQFVNRVRGH
jgi:imidazole glycerol-phosphate synthase subunit HisH